MIPMSTDRKNHGSLICIALLGVVMLVVWILRELGVPI